MSIPAFLNRLCCGFVEGVTCLGVAEEAETFQPQLWRRLPDYFERLIELLTDEKLWQQLHEKNVRALEQYFSWGAVAPYMKLLASN